jgi:hypothetical protein
LNNQETSFAWRIIVKFTGKLIQSRIMDGLCNAVRLECHIYSIDWPSCSPDLNPIENIWRVLKQRLRNRNPYGGWVLEDLKAAVLDIWENEISIDLINKFVNTMPERLEKVRLRKGEPSGW